MKTFDELSKQGMNLDMHMNMGHYHSATHTACGEPRLHRHYISPKGRSKKARETVAKTWWTIDDDPREYATAREAYAALVDRENNPLPVREEST